MGRIHASLATLLTPVVEVILFFFFQTGCSTVLKLSKSCTFPLFHAHIVPAVLHFFFFYLVTKMFCFLRPVCLLASRLSEEHTEKSINDVSSDSNVHMKSLCNLPNCIKLSSNLRFIL